MLGLGLGLGLGLELGLGLPWQLQHNVMDLPARFHDTSKDED